MLIFVGENQLRWRYVSSNRFDRRNQNVQLVEQLETQGYRPSSKEIHNCIKSKRKLTIIHHTIHQQIDSDILCMIILQLLKLFKQYVNTCIMYFQIDELCCEIVDELNSSKFTTNYFMYNGGFWARVWCFFVLGAPALSVLPLLVFLVIVGDITEETLAGVCSTLVIVPIVAVSIIVCCFVCLKVPGVGYFSLKNIKQSLCKEIKRENTKELSLNKNRIQLCILLSYFRFKVTDYFLMYYLFRSEFSK